MYFTTYMEVFNFVKTNINIMICNFISILILQPKYEGQLPKTVV